MTLTKHQRDILRRHGYAKPGLESEHVARQVAKDRLNGEYTTGEIREAEIYVKKSREHSMQQQKTF